MKKLIIILAILLASCGWHTRDKVLFGTFTALNLADIAQTAYIYDHPKEFREANPIMGRNTHVPIMAGVNVAAYFFADYLEPEHRTWFLVPMVLLKGVVVFHNNSLGVGFAMPF